MRKDIVLGALVSALILGSVFASSFFYPNRVPPAPDDPPAPLPPHVVIVLDEEKPPPSETDGEQEKPNDIDAPPPPRAPELPGNVDPDIPTQPLQPVEISDPIGPPAVTIPPGPVGPGSRHGPEIIDQTLLDRKPTPRAQIPPQYPFELRSAGIEGEVVVEFIVDTNGQVRNPTVVRSTQREFEAAALQAIAKWTFRPGRKGGRVVNAGRVQQLFTFRINE